jgi:uncharacterized protein
MKSRMFRCVWLLTICACIFSGCASSDSNQAQSTSDGGSFAETEQPRPSHGIVAAARSQIGVTVIYDPAYIELAYPGGDVPAERGVCTDVVIRALRDAVKMDLQELVHEDMTIAFSEYPAIWGLTKTDHSIDHRRVPNLMTYFERCGYSIEVSHDRHDYLPGDLVTCTVGRNLAHIMIVSDTSTLDGLPLIIHNIGSGVQEENRLFDFSLTGHYRINVGD